MSRAISMPEGQDERRSSGQRTRRWRRWAIRGGFGLGALAVGFVGAAALYQLAAGSLERASLTPPGEMVQVGDHGLYVHCTGESSGPTIVLESGMGVVSEAWTWVQTGLSERYRVCAELLLQMSDSTAEIGLPEGEQICRLAEAATAFRHFRIS